MIDRWVIVADGGQARFFATDAEMLDLVPEREVKNRHHSSHRGRLDEGSAHHAEEAAFAKELAHILTHAVQAQQVRELVLVAPAKFLGDLHAAIPATVTKHVAAQINKDFTKLERHELAKRVRSALVDHLDNAP